MLSPSPTARSIMDEEMQNVKDVADE